MDNKKAGLNSNQIKLISIIAMTIDHLVWTLFPGTQHIWYVMALHIIGRLTAPIMWFFIAEGCFYTHDMKKYIIRLCGFAVISHFAYDFSFGIPYFSLEGGLFNRTSVMLSLALSVVCVALSRSENIPQALKTLLIIGCIILGFPSDWSCIAVVCPMYIYTHRGDFRLQPKDIIIWSFVYAAVNFIFLDKPYGILQMFTFLTIPILSHYNGRRGEWKGMKWLFYIYYPAHLFIIGLLRILLHGNISTIF